MSVSFIDGHIDEPKMTDNEIIKALECCSKDDCDNCPNDFGNCYSNLAGWAIDLINRQKAELNQYAEEQHELMIEKDKLFDIAEKQKAEIENLKIELQAMRNAANGYKKEVEKLKKGINIELENYASEYDNKIKAEAVKEFAGEFERSLINMPQKDINYSNLVEHIENLVKRKGGEK